jgi:dipeptidyl aminopeptidase/acylaminoacyl peptidase
MVRFNDPSALSKDAVAKSSPNRKYVAIVTSQGLLDSDQTESTLSIYGADEIDAFLVKLENITAPRPQITIKMTAVLRREQSVPYGSVITDLRWSSDSRDLYYVAEGPSGNCRIYRTTIASRKTTAVTPADYSVVRFGFTSDVLVYSAWHSGHVDHSLEEAGNINADARPVSGDSLKRILFPHSQPAPTRRELWVVRSGNHQQVATRVPGSPQHDISWFAEAFSISPSGHKLIQLQPVDEIPPAWEHYEPAKGFEYLGIDSHDPTLVAADNLLRLKRYTLVDLDSGADVVLNNAPHAFSLAYGSANDSKAIWSPSERRVLLTNTFLPLDGVNAEERKRRLKPCAVADVRIPTLESQCIVFTSDLMLSGAIIEDLSFVNVDDEVALKVRLPHSGKEIRKYIFENDGWRLTKANSMVEKKGYPHTGDAYDAGVRLMVRQGLNEPPTLWATNISTGKSKQLWDPNPQLANLQFGEASVYRWRDSSGYEWKGGLVKPVGYAAGKRYPLVIQIYNFDETQFLTDGNMPTAFAARQLASAGIAVLQVQRRLPHTFDTAEADAQLAGFQGAIQALSDEGLIDAGKVGLVGFSASAWYIENALIKDPKRFAAATIAEGVDVSYLQYRFGISNPLLRREYETIIGAEPMGDGLKQWIATAPGFHLDRIVAPLRIEAMTPYSILEEWEIYSSLMQQRKPVDLIYFPEGQHIHQRPLERLASQEGDVDWFRFWLQGYDDPTPSKRAQYERWNKMRDLVSRTYPKGDSAAME